jgi:hypothetical protein
MTFDYAITESKIRIWRDELKDQTNEYMLLLCSQKQRRLYPNADTLSKSEMDLLHSISTLENDFIIIQKFEIYRRSWHDITTRDRQIHAYVLECIVRNRRLRVAATRELLALWKPYFLKPDKQASDIFLVLDYAVHGSVRELIRNPPAIDPIDDEDDVIALQEVLGELTAFQDFVHDYLSADTRLMIAIEAHIKKIHNLFILHHAKATRVANSIANILVSK